MKNYKTNLLVVVLINSILFSGCWNYREIDKLSIVAGVAIDKSTDSLYKIVVELAQTSGGKESKSKSKIITMQGRTLFDTARNGISISGEKLYWSHSKVIIVSRDIASEGLSKVLDWYTRDSETREDVYILISEEDTAGDIFQIVGGSDEIISILVGDTIKNGVSLGKAPKTDILKYEIETKPKEMSTVIPTIHLKQANGKPTYQVEGCAIIKDDKLAGFLKAEETKDLLFIRDEIKGGLLTEELKGYNEAVPVALEIFKSKTKVKPEVKGSEIIMNVNVETTVALGEIQGTGNLVNEEQLKNLEQVAQLSLKNRMEALIEKMQKEYDADIFGFGPKLNESYPKVWKSVSNNWGEVFKDIKVNVNTKVHIKNSGITSNTLREAEE